MDRYRIEVQEGGRWEDGGQAIGFDQAKRIARSIAKDGYSARLKNRYHAVCFLVDGDGNESDPR